MSSRFALTAGILLASLAALPLSAQQSTVVAPHDTSAAKAPAAKSPAAKSPAAHASSDSALVELGRTLTQLAVTVQTVIDQTKNNPEIRRAALATAGQAVSVAQKTLADNTLDIERMLAEASRRLAVEEAKQKAKLDAAKAH